MQFSGEEKRAGTCERYPQLQVYVGLSSRVDLHSRLCGEYFEEAYHSFIAQVHLVWDSMSAIEKVLQCMLLS